MGEIEITAAGTCLTASELDGCRQRHVGWYLSPMLHWLADNWIALLHEERFSWPNNKTAAPAAIACRAALGWVAPDDPRREEIWTNTQDWYRRHALRSTATGGIFPDLFIRRFADDVELSWSGLPVEYSPPGLVFESGAGQLRLPVIDAARPLWQTLCWGADQAATGAGFDADVVALKDKVRRLRDSPTPQLEHGYIQKPLFERARRLFEQIDRLDLFDHSTQDSDVPCILEFSPAVAMFGGVEPTLDDDDLRSMRDILVETHGGEDGSELAALVVDRRDETLGVPHQDGDRFATELLEDLDMLSVRQPVDVRGICRRLDVEIDQLELNTDSVRGIAFAGVGFSPRIVVNRTHRFNDNEAGCRFTIAHELCHVLFDRTRARRVAHVSGHWAPPAVEKRANAFAAYLLMPRGLVHESIRANQIDFQEIGRVAGSLQVNESALIEHLYNLNLIDEGHRYWLRNALRKAQHRPASLPD